MTTHHTPLAGRRLGKLLRLIITAVMGVVGLVLVAPASPAHADTCTSYWVVGVRGANESYDGWEGMGHRGAGPYAYAASIPLVVNTVQYDSLTYPASFNLNYYDSVSAGWWLLASQIHTKVSQCPGIRIGLIGFSEGAHVVNDTLNNLSAVDLDRVRAVLTLGDPVSDPTASYHIQMDLPGAAASRATHGGILGHQSLPLAVQARSTDLCLVSDPVCDSPFYGGVSGALGAFGVAIHLDGYPICCGPFHVAQILGNQFAQRMQAAESASPIVTKCPEPDMCGPLPTGSGTPPATITRPKRDDYTRDGTSDLVGVRTSDGCLARWAGNGHGGLDYTSDYGCGWNNYTDLAGVGDVNKDGVGDLVAVRKSDGCLARWYGSGGGGLDYAGDYGCGWNAYTNLVGLGDITSDHVGDLVAVRASDGCLARWYGNGGGGLDYAGDYGCGWNNYILQADTSAPLATSPHVRGALISDGTVVRYVDSGPDGSLRYWYNSGSGWSETTIEGPGTIAGNPTAHMLADGTIRIFARRTDNTLGYWSNYAGIWSSTSLGGSIAGDPTAQTASNGAIYVFARGTDNTLWYWSYYGGWTSTSLGGSVAGDPTAQVLGDGTVRVFVRGTDNTLWFWTYWMGWSSTSLGGSIAGDPAAVSANSQIQVIAPTYTGVPLHYHWNGAAWTTETL